MERIVIVSLVASPNGLGHARRQLQLAYALCGFAKRVNFFLSSRQFHLLSSESLSVGPKVVLRIVIIENYGLDGLVFGTTPYPSSIPPSISSILEKSSVVISDNSLWPANFTDNFNLMGHFNWVDHYWQYKKRKAVPLRVHEIVQEETVLMKRVRKWLAIRDFSMTSEINSKKLEIPLFKYEADKYAMKERDAKTWLSVGTTKSTTLREYDSLPMTDRKESWLMTQSKTLPRLVIGRAGLGTIRDCLASQTPFFPLTEQIDPEILHNIETLKNLELLFPSSFQSPLDLTSDELMSQSRRMNEYWKSNSVYPHEVAELILEECSK
jgi:hypothetical protein